MSLGFQRTLNTNSIPIWQGLDKDIQLAQGGFALIASGLPSGSIVPGGTPVIYDEVARTASIVGGGTIQANATNTATQYRVNKGNTLAIGNNFAAVSGGAAYPITAIDTSNSAYDLVTLGTTLGVAVTAGQGVFVSTATGATAAVYGAINGLSYDDVVIDYSVPSISVVIRGTCYARRLPSYTAALAAIPALSKIIFSTSK